MKFTFYIERTLDSNFVEPIIITGSSKAIYFTQNRSHQTLLSSKPGVGYDRHGKCNAKRLIKRQLMSKTASKRQQITMAPAATGTVDNEHHLCTMLLPPSSSLLDVTSSCI
jgi:hypothetical protein